MVPRVPEEIRKLRGIYKPYLDGCHLVEDAPEEAKEALKKEDEWYKMAFEKNGLYAE